MKELSKKFAKIMAAATFAEAGEHDTALRIIGARRPADARWRKVFERAMSAATYAEADCPRMVRDILNPSAVRKPSDRQDASLDEFLRAVGLEKASYRFGLATV